MSPFLPGPGDEVTWPYDPASDVSVEAEDIRSVIAWKTWCDPVGRGYGELSNLMVEESLLDDPDALDDAIRFLAQHMDDADFPKAVHKTLTEAFTSIAEQTDVQYELRRHRVEEPS